MDVCYNQFLGCIIRGSTIGIVIIGYLFSIRNIKIESENSTSTFGYTFTWLFTYFAADVNTKVGIRLYLKLLFFGVKIVTKNNLF